MAILERVVLRPYPGAITEVRVPFNCGLFPTIQQLAKFLMESGQPSVIIAGKLYTEESAADVELSCVP